MGSVAAEAVSQHEYAIVIEEDEDGGFVATCEKARHRRASVREWYRPVTTLSIRRNPHERGNSRTQKLLNTPGRIRTSEPGLQTWVRILISSAS